MGTELREGVTLGHRSRVVMLVPVALEGVCLGQGYLHLTPGSPSQLGSGSAGTSMLSAVPIYGLWVRHTL